MSVFDNNTNIKTAQKQIIDSFRKAYPDYANLSDAEILTVMNEQLDNIKVSEDEKISAFWSNDKEFNPFKIDKKPSNITLNTEELNKKLEQRLKAVFSSLEKTESKNGLIGKIWSGFKNLTGIGDSSDKVREKQLLERELIRRLFTDTEINADIFKELTSEDFNEANLTRFINGEIKLKSEIALNDYIEGQDMACDITGDIVSGIGALGMYSMTVALIPVSGGLSVAAAGILGAGFAIGSGSLIKAGIKYADAKSGNKEYDSLKRDFATGAFSGLLAPFTGGLGGAVGKTLATKFGIEIFKQGTKQLAIDIGMRQGVKQGFLETLKSVALNPAGYSYDGTLWKQFMAYGAEMASDGMLGGAVDTAFRTGYDGGDIDEVLLSGLEGGIGGLFFAPIIGGGMKGAGKAGHFLGNKFKGFNNQNNPVKEIDKFKKIEQSGKYYKKLQLSKASQQKINSILNSKKSSGVFKKLKTAMKRQAVKQGEPRFNQNELNGILNRINNSYMKENQGAGLELLSEMAEMKGSGNNLFKSFGGFYHFNDGEIVEILELVNEKNIDILKLMLKSRDKECVYKGNLFKSIFKKYSDYGTETSSKVIKMLESNQSMANDIDKISNCLTLTKEYPNEIKFLTNNFNPKQAEKIFSGEMSDITKLLKLMKSGTLEERNLIEVLLSPKNTGGYIDIKTVLKIMEADTGLNNGQIITFCSISNRSNSGTDVDKLLNKFVQKKGKEFVFSGDSMYKKDKSLTKDDIFKTVRFMGLSEEESNAFCNLDVAEVIIKMLELDEMSDSLIFGGMAKIQIIKGIMKFFESNTSDELLEPVKAIKSISGYINKENFEIFKKHKPDGTFEQFSDDMSQKITQTECQGICSIVHKLTGKTVYENDLHILGSDMLYLINLKEHEVSNAIKKLKDLGLINDDSNIMTLLTKTEELSKIKVTPEIQAFAKELSENRFIEEGSVIDILHAVQSENNNIVKTKTGYAKELIENLDITQEAVPIIIKNLSNTNEEILNKQILLLNNVDSSDMQIYSKFIKTDNLEEFDISKNFLEKLEEKCGIEKLNILNSVMSLRNKDSRTEVVAFITTLLSKDFKTADISELLYAISTLGLSAQKEFMKLFLKGFDMDLGSLKKSFIEILFAYTSDIKNMNIREKLNLYEKLSSIGDNEKIVLKQIGIDYNGLLNKIIDSIGIKRKIVTLKPEKKKLFLKHIVSNNNSKAEQILKSFNFEQYGKQGLPLKYTRDNFNSNVEALLKDLPEYEVSVILKHFGLERGAAGFDGLPNNLPLNDTTISKEGMLAAQKLQKEIEDFMLNNEVLMEDAEAKSIFDSLIKGMPEFTSVVGKQQHGRHDYSVDIHTLKVLQSAMKDPLYETLSDQDKTILKYSVLLHDFGKKGGVVDEGHASLSADYVWSILDRFSFPPGVKDRIIDIVDNHHWFEAFNTGIANAENIAVRCRRPEDLKIYEIFSKADFENVNPTFHLGDKTGGASNKAEFDAYMMNKFKAIEEAVDKIYQKANFIFDSQFMHRGKLFPTEEIELNGKKAIFRVLDFNKLIEGEDLEKYGFAPGVTRENARFIVHMTEPKYSNLETVFKLTEIPTYQSTWSSSLIQMASNNTYWGKNFGVIFEIPQANYSEAFWGNSHSGGEKGLDAFQNFLFGSRKIKAEDINGELKTWDVRHYVRDNFIKEMIQMGYDLNEAEYAQLSRYLFGKKYISQIRKDIQIGDKVISSKDLVSALEKSRDELFYGNEHNEIIPITPKVKGIFAKVEKLEDCPKELLNFAQEHDLPIILMKPAERKQHDKIHKNLNKATIKKINNKP